MTSSSDIEALISIVADLRAPETGCAWDLAQDHASLVPYVLEEAYEVVDAIGRGSADDLRDELGDLLLQIVFHAQISSESDGFAFSDVVRAIREKLIRRHPHVFAGAAAAGEATPVTTNSQWDRIKAAEREAKGGVGRVLDNVPLALPGLTRAVKLQKKASGVGFDWGDVRLVLAKVREEIEEVERALEEDPMRRDAAVADEVGDLLFAIANLARHAGIDPEQAVRGTNAKFERRFAYIEDRLADRHSAPARSSLEEMDGLWNEAKAAGL